MGAARAAAAHFQEFLTQPLWQPRKELLTWTQHLGHQTLTWCLPPLLDGEHGCEHTLGLACHPACIRSPEKWLAQLDGKVAGAQQALSGLCWIAGAQ